MCVVWRASRVTRRTRVASRTSQVTSRMSYVANHKSHVENHTSGVTRRELRRRSCITPFAPSRLGRLNCQRIANVKIIDSSKIVRLNRVNIKKEYVPCLSNIWRSMSATFDMDVDLNDFSFANPTKPYKIQMCMIHARINTLQRFVF